MIPTLNAMSLNDRSSSRPPRKGHKEKSQRLRGASLKAHASQFPARHGACSARAKTNYQHQVIGSFINEFRTLISRWCTFLVPLLLAPPKLASVVGTELCACRGGRNGNKLKKGETEVVDRPTNSFLKTFQEKGWVRRETIGFWYECGPLPPRDRGGHGARCGGLAWWLQC